MFASFTGCRKFGSPGCRRVSGSVPRSASCFILTYLLQCNSPSMSLSHTHSITHTLTPTVSLQCRAVIVSTGQFPTTFPILQLCMNPFFLPELHADTVTVFPTWVFLYLKPTHAIKHLECSQTFFSKTFLNVYCASNKYLKL